MYEFCVPLPGVDDRMAASVVHRGSCPGHITMLVASGGVLGNTVLVGVLLFLGPRSEAPIHASISRSALI